MVPILDGRSVDTIVPILDGRSVDTMVPILDGRSVNTIGYLYWIGISDVIHPYSVPELQFWLGFPDLDPS